MGAGPSGGWEALMAPPAKWEALSHSDAGVISTDANGLAVTLPTARSRRLGRIVFPKPLAGF